MEINPNNHPTLVGIDEDVLTALTQQAVPFIDDPNAVLRRVLGLDEPAAPAHSNGDRPAAASPEVVKAAVSSARSHRSQGGRSKAAKKPTPPRAPKGSLTPEDAFERPILEVLNDAGGAMPTREAVAAIGSRMVEVLNEHDQFRDDSGVARWEKRVPFVRLRLVERGLLDRDAPRGVWQLTDEGREALKQG